MRASISCPTAGKVVSFDLPTDAATVAKCWSLQIRIACPHCGALHAAPFKDAYVDGVLAGVGTMPQNSFFTNLPDAPQRKMKHAEPIHPKITRGEVAARRPRSHQPTPRERTHS